MATGGYAVSPTAALCPLLPTDKQIGYAITSDALPTHGERIHEWVVALGNPALLCHLRGLHDSACVVAWIATMQQMGIQRLRLVRGLIML